MTERPIDASAADKESKEEALEQRPDKGSAPAPANATSTSTSRLGPGLSVPVEEEIDEGDVPPPNVGSLLTPVQVAEPARPARSLNETIHDILTLGLGVSAALLVGGVVVMLLSGVDLPAQTLTVGEAFRQALSLRPDALITLGLLALIATPILRVIGSILVFLWERDWLFAGITLLVFAIMLLSMRFGEG